MATMTLPRRRSIVDYSSLPDGWRFYRRLLVTFTDTNGNGHYDMMELRRYSLDADQPDRQFGLTGKPNPYVITFPTRNN